MIIDTNPKAFSEMNTKIKTLVAALLDCLDNSIAQANLNDGELVTSLAIVFTSVISTMDISFHEKLQVLDTLKTSFILKHKAVQDG